MNIDNWEIPEILSSKDIKSNKISLLKEFKRRMYELDQKTIKHFSQCFDSRIAGNTNMQRNLARYLQYEKNTSHQEDVLKARNQIRETEESKSDVPHNIFSYYQVWLASKDKNCNTEFKNFKQWFLKKRRTQILTQNRIDAKQCRIFYRDQMVTIAKVGTTKDYFMKNETYVVCQICKPTFKPNPKFNPRTGDPKYDCIKKQPSIPKPDCPSSTLEWNSESQIPLCYYTSKWRCPNLPTPDTANDQLVTICPKGTTLNPLHRIRCPIGQNDPNYDPSLCIRIPSCAKGQRPDWENVDSKAIVGCKSVCGKEDEKSTYSLLDLHWLINGKVNAEELRWGEELRCAPVCKKNQKMETDTETMEVRCVDKCLDGEKMDGDECVPHCPTGYKPEAGRVLVGTDASMATRMLGLSPERIDGRRLTTVKACIPECPIGQTNVGTPGNLDCKEICKDQTIINPVWFAKSGLCHEKVMLRLKNDLEAFLAENLDFCVFPCN